MGAIAKGAGQTPYRISAARRLLTGKRLLAGWHLASVMLAVLGPELHGDSTISIGALTLAMLAHILQPETAVGISASQSRPESEKYLARRFSGLL